VEKTDLVVFRGVLERSFEAALVVFLSAENEACFRGRSVQVAIAAILA